MSVLIDFRQYNIVVDPRMPRYDNGTPIAVRLITIVDVGQTRCLVLSSCFCLYHNYNCTVLLLLHFVSLQWYDTILLVVILVDGQNAPFVIFFF